MGYNLMKMVNADWSTLINAKVMTKRSTTVTLINATNIADRSEVDG